MNNDILDLIGKRLIKGERKYGHENVASDGRDFVKEALEEALDCAVYLAARLVEIENNNNKGETMGAKINMENDIHDIQRRLKLLEDAFEESIQTRIHDVDLTEDLTMENHGIEIKPDKEFTTPVRVKRSTPKTKKTKAATATT